VPLGIDPIKCRIATPPPGGFNRVDKNPKIC